MRSCSRILAALVLAASAAGSARAMDAAAERGERDRIKVERDQAEAAYVARERECREKFVVTSCIEQAKRDRRQALERLRQQQEVLDEAQRKQRAAQRVEDIRSRVSSEDAKQRDASNKPRPQRAASAASAASAAASEPTAVVINEPPSAVRKPAASRASEIQAHGDKAEAAEKAYDKRQEEAREHRAQVQRRNAERAASGKPPAKGLPTPTPASAAH